MNSCKVLHFPSRQPTFIKMSKLEFMSKQDVSKSWAKQILSASTSSNRTYFADFSVVSIVSVRIAQVRADRLPNQLWLPIMASNQVGTIKIWFLQKLFILSCFSCKKRFWSYLPVLLMSRQVYTQTYLLLSLISSFC